METKRLILSVTLMLALLLGWRLLMNHIYKLHPTWATQTTEPPATIGTSAAPVGATTVPSTGPVMAGTTQPTISSAGLAVVNAPLGMTAKLGEDPQKYQMVLSVDPRGAGLESVVLSAFYDTSARISKYKFQQPIDGFESITSPMATRSVSIDGKTLDVSACIWKQEATTPDSATYTTVVTDSGLPLLGLSKTYKLQPRDSKEGNGYEVQLTQGFRNLSGKPIKVSAAFNGPTPPARENDRSEDRRYVTGYDDLKAVETGSVSVSDLAKDKPAKDLIGMDPRPILWLGACSSYFESIYRPDYAGQTPAPAIRLAAAPATGIDQGLNSSLEYPTQLAIATSDFTLQPAATASLPAHVFFGPKERSLLKDDFYAAFPRTYDATLVYRSGPCGYITFTWLINTLYGILWFFHSIFRDWGIAIICLVALVRTMLHPLTKRSQISMVEMSKKGPEMERLKKKFADDKESLLKAQAELMNPLGMLWGCAPMLLQTPIWIALWSALQSTFELRQAGFLRFGHVHLTWISDLSHPDALITFSKVALPLIFFHPVISQVNILPLLLAVVFFIQQALQPVPPNMTPEQEQQRKMMKWMSLLFPVMLYSGPSGLTLYILTSTTIGIIESKIIRDHIKQRDEAEKAGRVIVDAAPTRGNRSRRDGDDLGSLVKRGKSPKKPSGLIGNWLADLQAKVEQAKREAERRGSK